MTVLFHDKATKFPEAFYKSLKVLFIEKPDHEFEIHCKRFAAALLCYLEGAKDQQIPFSVLLGASALIVHLGMDNNDPLTPERLTVALNAFSRFASKFRED